MAEEIDKALLRKYSGWPVTAKIAESKKAAASTPETRRGPGRPRNDDGANG